MPRSFRVRAGSGLPGGPARGGIIVSAVAFPQPRVPLRERDSPRASSRRGWGGAGPRRAGACRLRRAVLEVRVLDGDLALLEREHVAAVDFDLLAVDGGAREDPLRGAAVA